MIKALTSCRCVENNGNIQCKVDVKVIPNDEAICLCAFDRDTGDAWPCYYNVR